MSSARKELEAYADGQRAVLRMLRRAIDKGTGAKMTGEDALIVVANSLDASIREIDAVIKRSVL